RAVLIGHHRDLPFPGLPTPSTTRHRTVGDAFAGIPERVDGIELPGDRKYLFAGREYDGAFAPRELHLGRNYTKLSKDRFAEIPPGGNRHDLPDHLLARCWVNHRS